METITGDTPADRQTRLKRISFPQIMYACGKNQYFAYDNKVYLLIATKHLIVISRNTFATFV